jgi:hypothetical protein
MNKVSQRTPFIYLLLFPTPILLVVLETEDRKKLAKLILML